MDHLKPLLDRLALNDALVVRPTGATQAYVAYRGKFWHVSTDDQSFYLSPINARGGCLGPYTKIDSEDATLRAVITA